MLFKEPKIVRGFFEVDEKTIKRDNVVKLSITNVKKPLDINVHINSVDLMPDATHAIGYYLDSTQWYMAYLLYTKNPDEANELVLAPRDFPSLRRSSLRAYYMEQIENIEKLSDNLA